MNHAAGGGGPGDQRGVQLRGIYTHCTVETPNGAEDTVNKNI